MKRILIILASFFFSISGINAQQGMSFHDFIVTDIDGKPFHLRSLEGKKVLVVNTASKCGFTPQYEDLERLYEEYGDEGLVVIGFPSNDFLGQEPGSDEEIKEFCQLTYGVTFPMMSKISVKGRDIHPVYQWLTTKELNGVMDSNVSWNFQKYLIDEEGNLVATFKPADKPYSEEIIAWLNEE